jgi:GntR family transcriptional repressor for pyruvate dehydrogenase complex
MVATPSPTPTLAAADAAAQRGTGIDADAGGERMQDGDAFAALIEGIRAQAGEHGRLPAERALADALGANRHQVRKALKALRETGELSAHPGRAAARTRAQNVTLLPPPGLLVATSPTEVVELRLSVEPAMARMAATRATPAEINAIAAVFEAGLGEGQPRSADVAFHQAIAAGCGNRLIAEVVAFFNRIDADHRLRLTLPPETLVAERAEHAAILNAIVARDPVAAENAMMDHLHSVQLWLLRRQTR